jgi:DNA-binding MarR family transcriptional regulator
MRQSKAENLSPRPSRTKGSVSAGINLGQLGNSVGYALRLASFFATQQFHEVMQPFALRPAQFSTLVLVAVNPGVTQRELCETLGIEKANFVGLLDILERRKLVERRAEARDRRRYAIHLTSDGQVLLQKALLAHAALESRLKKKLLSGTGKDLLINLARLREKPANSKKRPRRSDSDSAV